jgi:ribosomal protein S18 acetylase RimI-like enzyme
MAPRIDPTRTAVRLLVADDLPALATIIDRTELFPSEMLGDMTSGFTAADDPEAAGDMWLTATVDGAPAGVCFARAEALTEGTWNMLALAVSPDHQGGGLGAAMTADLERRLAGRGVRILVVDTSGTDGFALTREFYRKQGYEPEARIRDYWAAGDDKVTFRKALRHPAVPGRGGPGPARTGCAGPRPATTPGGRAAAEKS